MSTPTTATPKAIPTAYGAEPQPASLGRSLVETAQITAQAFQTAFGNMGAAINLVTESAHTAIDSTKPVNAALTSGHQAAVASTTPDQLTTNRNRNMLESVQQDIALANRLLDGVIQDLDLERLASDPVYLRAVAADMGQTNMFARQTGLRNADQILIRLQDQYMDELPKTLVTIYGEAEDSPLLEEGRQTSEDMLATIERVREMFAPLKTLFEADDNFSFASLQPEAFLDEMVAHRRHFPEADKRERRKDPEQEYYTQYKFPEDKALDMTRDTMLAENPRLLKKYDPFKPREDQRIFSDRRIHTYIHQSADEHATKMIADIYRQFATKLYEQGFKNGELDMNRPGVQAGIEAAMAELLAVPNLYTKFYDGSLSDPQWDQAMENAVQLFHHNIEAHGEVFVDIPSLSNDEYIFLLTGKDPSATTSN